MLLSLFPEIFWNIIYFSSLSFLSKKYKYCRENEVWKVIGDLNGTSQMCRNLEGIHKEIKK